MVAGKRALQDGGDLSRSADLGSKTALELATAGGLRNFGLPITQFRVSDGKRCVPNRAGLSEEAATRVAAQTASEIASDASRTAGKIFVTGTHKGLGAYMVEFHDGVDVKFWCQ